MQVENKKKETGVVYRQQEIATGIFDMWIETSLAAQARAGQFISVYPQDKSTLLPRPISICEADAARGRLRIVYRVAGKGTKEFSGYRAGMKVDILGTLGNGFPVAEAVGKRVLLMGGGIGIPPMLALAKALKDTVTTDIVLGYRNKELFLSEELARYGAVHIATEDGSAGTRGNVMDAIAAEGPDADIIFACGPMPMLRAVKQYAQERALPAYISLEERMACGVGACLGCVVRTRQKDAHSHVNNARICTDGPVYPATEVEL
ncbi:MAG: dihydroorotate dehydrogenase electron transfer subunit [Roseburia sp.]|nr:dihydroorotate dehydrogenase electron transfer subunit [Roseburia sp.]